MALSWRVILGLPLALVLAGCPGREVGDPEARDPEGVFGDVALAEGNRVCEVTQGDLLVFGVVLAHADVNMHRIGECLNPMRPLYTHEQQMDQPPGEQDLYVRVGENRYLRVMPEQ